MKKYILSAVCLFLCCVCYAQEKNNVQEILEAPLPEECSVWNADDKSRNACLKKHAQDLRFAIDTEMRNKAISNNFNYASLAPQKTQKEIDRQKFISFLIWFSICLSVSVGCFLLFRMTKNKIRLRIKQRSNKHTLDDVFAVEKKE